MSDHSKAGPETVGSQASTTATVLTSEDSLTAEITRRRVRERLFGDADGPLVVGPFVLRERIGAGAMGTVYAAWDERLDRKVALKFLARREHAGDEDRGLREAKALASLAHPNVVSVFDVGTYEGRVWLAMEFVVGSTMRAWVEERPRSRSEILARWAEVGRGLAAVHALNLVHRDLKPDNVLVDEGGRARLIDFGLVCAAQAPVSTIPSGDDDPSPTVGGFVGTQAYAAPEQRRGEAVDGRADQYAFCVCVWESLVGSRPERDERGALLPGAGAELPRRIRRALRRGLAVEAERRFPNIDALVTALAPPSSRLLVALGFVLTGSLGALVGLALQPESPTPAPCSGADAAIDELWTTSRREAIAAQSSELELELETWAGEWRRQARANCEARHRRVLSADLADRRQACLDRRLLEFEALLDWVSASTRLGVTTVPVLVDPAACLSATLPRASVPPPELAERIAATRRELERIERDVDPSPTALAFGDALLLEATELGWPRLIGEAHVVTARSHRFAGDVTQAGVRLGQAIDIAQRIGDDELAFEAWSGMVQLKTEMELDARAARWAWQRQLAVGEALGPLPIHRGTLAFNAGAIAQLDGAPQVAELELREALTHFEHAGVTGRYRQVQVYDVLAAMLALEGRSEDSRRALEQSEQLRELLGHAQDELLLREGDHAFSTGLAQFAAGDLDAARTELERALAAHERALGGGQRVAQVLVALASVEDAAGRGAEARRHAELADAVCVAELSPMHPLRASTQSAIGTIALRDGRVEQAVDAFSRALEIETAYQQAGGTDRALAHSNLAEALVAAGRIAEAREHAELALAELRDALPDDHRDLAYAHKAMGLVLLAEDRRSEAAEQFRRAIALHGEAIDSQPELDELDALLARTREPSDHH